MIALLVGRVQSNVDGELVVLTSGGVGYKMLASPAALQKAKVGEETILETHLVVRDDALELYAFGSVTEKKLFQSFVSVSGVGPKTALHLLELGSAEEITRAISRGDLEYLTKVSGIGKKTAERIVLELKSKMHDQGFSAADEGGFEGDGVLGDVIDGLVTLGYSALEARAVVKKLDAGGKTSEQLLREALQTIK